MVDEMEEGTDEVTELEDPGRAFSFIVGLAVGTLVGAGAALLLAPHSGRRTRRRIVRAAEDLSETARDRIDDATDDVRRRAHTAARAAERGKDRIRETVRSRIRPDG